MFKTLELPIQGTQIRFLNGQVRSHLELWCSKKKKKKKDQFIYMLRPQLTSKG